MQLLLLLFPFLSFASPTMLMEAEATSKRYEQQVAKEAPPQKFPLTEQALGLSSVWFHLNLEEINTPEFLAQEDLWIMLKNIGIQGLSVQNLREKGQLKINPKWEKYWPAVIENTHKYGISLIGDLVGNATGINTDFERALQNVGDYPTLYHLIAVDSEDWNLLPEVPPGACDTNVPWLTLQELQKKGYVPEQSAPYTKESAWNATVKIIGIDGKLRRWIYLKEGQNHPVLAWMSPSFAAYRMASGDALKLNREFGQQTIQLDGQIPSIAEEMLTLWIRKIGAYSVSKAEGTLEAIASASTDLVYDRATGSALLHALITEDAAALRMIYFLFLSNAIDTKKFVHILQPFDQYTCDWTELMHAPKKKFLYKQEQITGEVLRQRLLREDVLKLGGFDKISPSTWVGYCARALGFKDFDKHVSEIKKAHLLLSFAYAMQPGVFSISLSDLLGALPDGAKELNPMQSCDTCLYPSIPLQLKIPLSFASQLKEILQARRESNIKTADLVDVLPCSNTGTLLLLYRLQPSRSMYLLALNFARHPIAEGIEHVEISQTTAIDLLAKHAEEKVFSSSQFSFTLPPLSGKAFLFQPKYYNE